MPARCGIGACQRLAAQHNSVCLSEKYITRAAKYRWRCANGHEWIRSFINAKYGKIWCQQCDGNAVLTIDDCREIAHSYGGKFLSNVYENSYTKYLWECQHGHTWDAAFSHIKYHDAWCPHCACNVLLTTDDCRSFAESKGGKFLSPEYKTVSDIYEWECAQGHRWSTSFAAVRNNGNWCEKCHFIKIRQVGLQECRRLAELNKGEFLSAEYINVSTNYDWKCANGHTFNTTAHTIKYNQTWCPYCRYKSEHACREILSELFRERFDKYRPRFLEGMELDGYCAKLQLAFEYNGRQHETFVEFFHGDENGFKEQINRDEKKHMLCIEYDIYLLSVPSIYTYRDPEAMKSFIVNELKNAGYIN